MNFRSIISIKCIFFLLCLLLQPLSRAQSQERCLSKFVWDAAWNKPGVACVESCFASQKVTMANFDCPYEKICADRCGKKTGLSDETYRFLADHFAEMAEMLGTASAIAVAAAALAMLTGPMGLGAVVVGSQGGGAVVAASSGAVVLMESAAVSAIASVLSAAAAKIMQASGKGDGDDEKAHDAFADDIANGHAWEKHVTKKGEFPEIKTRRQFRDLVRDVMRNPDDYAKGPKGNEIFWRQKDGTMVVKDPAKRDGGTAFRPPEGKGYFDRKKAKMGK